MKILFAEEFSFGELMSMSICGDAIKMKFCDDKRIHTLPTSMGKTFALSALNQRHDQTNLDEHYKAKPNHSNFANRLQP